MKKFLTIVAIMMMTLCGSMVLVSCSNNYKKMYLVVEYALPTEDKEINWIEVGADENFDYTISDSNSKLYMRVKVKGTSKKVDSLYVSQSANNSTFLQNNTIKPNETFEVLVKNIGSVRFTVTPSQGGEDKAISFGVNIYKKLTGVSQNPDCVPAVVTGGYIELGKLTNLIKYSPIDETNQTGVDFEIAGVGTLNNNGATNLIDRDFQVNGNFEKQIVDDSGSIIDKFVNTQNGNGSQVSLERGNDGVLRLNVSNTDQYKKYALSNENNVIKLIATSQYDKTLQTPVYVYIVENFENALLVSYNPNAEEVVDVDGNVKDDVTITKPINNNIVIYDSAINENTIEQEYNSISIYTYTSTSIYSYETNPGLKLNVFVDEFLYNYNDIVDNNFGIQISPIVNHVAGQDKLVGLKFSVNPNSLSNAKEYKIRLEVDFTAFDFSASDKAPVSVLNKEFAISVESLASGFRVNGKGYSDNLQQIKADNTVPNVADYYSAKSAVLYTNYDGNIKGMSLDIQATPEDASERVYVGFYKNYAINADGELEVESEDNLISTGNEGSNVLQLVNPFGYSVGTTNDAEFGTQFVIESTKGKGIEYFLKINPFANVNIVENLGKSIYMVCRAVCTPDLFGGQEVETSYITFVSKIDVVGAINNIYLYKSEGNNVEEDTLTDMYLQNGVANTMYVRFTSTSSVVDLSDILINSKGGKIKFSHNGITWLDEIKAGELDCINNVCKLYFKTERECVDSVVITSPNGVTKSREYEFVNVADNIEIEYDKTYIWDSKAVDDVTYVEYIKDEKGTIVETREHDTDLRYLALQSGKTVQFNVKGDNKGANINLVRAKSLLVTSVEYLNIKKGGESLYSKAISTFSASAIRVTNLGGNLFDIQANSVGFTAILFVKVDYYTHTTIEGKTSIQLQSKYFVYEVAIYNPARDISVNTDKDSIIYINDNYVDVATINFNVALNSRVTRNIYFSSETVNDLVNNSYADNEAIYDIKVRYGYDSDALKENDDDEEMLSIVGLDKDNNAMYLNSSTNRFTIRALKSLVGIETVRFEFMIRQFGKELDVSKTIKIVSVGSYNASDRVIIVSGVEAYNNIYLSIGDSKDVKAYASNDNNDVTYKDLGFELYQIANDQAGDRLIPYTGKDLTIEHNTENDTFTIKSQNNGGVYLLRLIAKDSEKYTDIKITVSDGKSEETAYLIKTPNDFKRYLTGDTSYMVGAETKPLYYTLWQDIDFEGLEDTWWTDWWTGNRQFGGVLNGSIVIEDLNSDRKITRNYTLKNFEINASSIKVIDNNNCFGLFSMITSIGQINNVAFDSVKVNVVLNSDNTATNAITNIGIIAGINNGQLNNCSIALVSGKQSITLANSALSPENNIGLVIGKNVGTITYQTISTGSAYSRMVDCSGAQLVVTAQKGNTNFDNDTMVNIGGVVGLNTKYISANYSDNSSASIRELISVVTNIEFVSEYDNSNAPMNITANFGGVVGLNNGSVEGIAMSGALKANDNVNIGGVVGNNTANVQEVANYGAVIEGYCYNDTLGDNNRNDITITSQNIGGIIGYNNAGNVDNVRTMFIMFENGEVGVHDAVTYIQGLGNVAGVIGYASSTQLMRAYVENFVEDSADGSNYNIIGKGIANVAGLIASSTSSSAYLSFVQADFDVQGCTFNEFGSGLTYNYVYFIGDVNGVTVSKQSVEGKGYIVINETIKSGFGVDGKLLASNGTQGDYIIEWCVDTQEEDVAKKINKGYPYLRYKLADDIAWTYTLTIRPTDIFVDVDDSYFDVDDTETENVTEQGIYIEYEDDVDENRVRATAVVYYYENGNNTHKLISDDVQKGLVEKTILPSIANGTYVVSILEGGAIATLTDADSTITFSSTGRVVLKFASAFDRKKTDIVVIFVENPLDNKVFDISTSAGIEKSTDTRYVTRVSTNSIVSLGLISVDGQIFDTSKVKYDAQIISGDKLYIDELTSGTADRHQFEIKAGELDKDVAFVDVVVTITAYLDLAKYNVGYDNQILLSEARNEEVELVSKTITITIYNWATGLSVPSNSNTKAESGIAIPVKATLITGYNSAGSGTFTIDGTEHSYSIIGDNNHILDLKANDMDTVDYVLTAKNSNARNLANKVIELEQEKGAKDVGTWTLFEPIIVNYLSTATGIDFKLTLRIKEEYRYLNLEGEEHNKWEFTLEILANNGKLKASIEIAFVPQQLNNFRLENYSNLVVRSTSNSGESIAEAEYISNQTESSLIIPGTSGLIKVFAEYDYSYFDDISITSSREVIDGKEYFIRFQQMVYNKDTGFYQSYAGITADGETLSLKKVSNYENGQYTYEGVIFVRTILDDVVGVRKTFTMTVNATTYDLDGISTQISMDKTVITQYRPEVTITASNVIEDELTIDENKTIVYLIEKGSDLTTVTARIFGYEYNAQPHTEITDFDGESLGDSEVEFYQYGDTYKDSTGATVITYKLKAKADKPFKLLMVITLLDNGNTLTNKSSVLTFYPVDYILDSVRISGEVNGGLNIPVNNSKDLKLEWKTKDGAEISSRNNAINAEISSKLDFLTLFYISKGNDSGLLKYYDGDSFVVEQSSITRDYYITAKKREENSIPVTFTLWYGYEFTTDGEGEDKVELRISEVETEICNHFIPYEFMLNLTLQTSEDAPTPITSVAGLRALGDGEDGILLNDLTIDLNSWTPITANIASLDGNGKVISFTGNSFNVAVATEMDTGLLFASVGEDTILKNVVINISTLQTNVIYIKDDNIAGAKINFGLLAGVNNGLIYNCEVISLADSTELELAIGNDYSLTFGGLVGVNNGNITNSRVGTEYFEQITPSGNEGISTIIGCGVISLKTSGIVAGFVGSNLNNAIISSSFVANTNIENISDNGNDTYNRTAGFVATNSGTVAYSYAKGIESSIRDSRSRATRGQVYASGAGSAAGFVYMNTGKIHDCYSNIVCKSNSAGVAGFVYNTSNISAEIIQCYSASIVESGNTNNALATELPFVGVGIVKNEAQQLLSNENMQYCYYLDDGTTEYDANYKLDDKDVEAVSMSLESFARSSSLSGFTFVDGTIGQELNGIWTYSTMMDPNRSTYSLVYTSLPELTSANAIARSVRILVNQEAGNNDQGYKISDYGYLKGYDRGTKTNPYIVRDAEEYSKVFVTGEQVAKLTERDVVVENGEVREDSVTKENFVGYVRFVGHIDFSAVEDDNSTLSLDTRTTYVLGDRDNREITSIDGNGMTISNIAISYVDRENGIGSLGLFSEVSYSVIKSMKLGYTEVGSSTATYVGGVAGIANDTYFIDLELNGSDTELFANNIAGGVVGKLSGNHAGIYNVTSNLDVKVGYYQNSASYSATETKMDALKRSYAGGIAGIIDATNGNAKLSKVTVNSANIRANRAGGIAGYLSNNISAERLIYNISESSQIFGREVAGGLVAENSANIQLSQANNANNLDQQYEHDKAFGEYIQTKKDVNDEEVIEPIINTNNRYGNLSAITGQQIMGGLIGINHDGRIDNSLTKANISHNVEYDWSSEAGDDSETIIGGLIGVAYGGDLSFVYAQNYIDLNYKNEEDKLIYADVVGGLIGEAKHNGNASTTKLGMDNIVAINFFDKQQIKDHATTDGLVDYVVGVLDGRVDVVKDTSGGAPTINYGVFNGSGATKDVHTSGTITINDDVKNANSFNMEDLYTSTSTSTQQDIFNSLFASWSNNYWEKLYTRFTPNIKLNGASDYIVIDDAEDIGLMNSNPDANFILTSDVDIEGANYIVTTPFTGILTGVKIEDTDGSTRYTRFNVGLNASTNNDNGAGFFKQTTGAKISNIGFNYTTEADSLSNTVDLHDEFAFYLGGSGTYDFVGAVSAQDTDSRFDNIVVTSEAGGEAKPIKTESGTKVKVMGSIVGSATRSQVLGCNSSIGFDVSSSEGANIGGLVGTLQGERTEVEKDNNGQVLEGEDNKIHYYDGLISSSEYLGNISIKSGSGVNLGGIVGSARYTRISSVSAGKVSISNGSTVIDNLELQIASSNDNSIGGVVAIADMCSIEDSSAMLDITDINTTTSIALTTSTTTSTSYYVGGIAGQINNSTIIDKDSTNEGKAIIDSYAKLTFNLFKADDAIIGGIVAKQNSSANVILEGVYAETYMNKYPNTAASNRTAGTDLITSIKLGGIIGEAGGDKDETSDDKSTTIKDSMAVMYTDVEYAKTLIGGGLIGHATGSYKIDHSTAMGYIFANNSSARKIGYYEGNPTLTTLGGMVGLVGQCTDGSTPIVDNIAQSINNSYTALTLSTANVYRSANDVAYVNGVIGWYGDESTPAQNQSININKVVYSSDYTLSLEEGNLVNNKKFTSEPVNVSANMLTIYDDASKTSYVDNYLDTGWLYNNEKLPIPQSNGVIGALQELKILEIDSSTSATITYNFTSAVEGKPYAPIMVESTTFNEDISDYQYYILGNGLTTTFSDKTLNGVLLGSGLSVKSTSSLFKAISEHSAVSNLRFSLENVGENKFENGAVATINKGTIFMCAVDYTDLNVGELFGGLVFSNTGVISNCFNVGNGYYDGNDDGVAGLTYQNGSDASIIDCYFTGSIKYVEKVKDADGNETGEENITNIGCGITCVNLGYIANTYSAGQTKLVINTFTNGRHDNVRYDYYANHVTSEDDSAFEGVGIIGMETLGDDNGGLQAIDGTTDSRWFKGWKVYSMHNWTEDDQYLDADEVVGGSGKPVDTTYNYGYPIHNIKQYVYDGGVQAKYFRPHETGNGTFKQLISDSKAETNPEGTIARGQLVADVDEDLAAATPTYTIKGLYDNNSFKINNLGVLSLIDAMATKAGTEGRYYMLEVDISRDSLTKYQGTLFSTWEGIGSTKSFEGIFSTSSITKYDVKYESSGVQKQTKVLILDSVFANINADNIHENGALLVKDANKYATRLTGAMFNKVGHNAIIANLTIQNSKLTTGAPLINCIGSEGGGAQVAVYNIKISTVDASDATGNIAGLINKVESGNVLTIQSVQTSITISSGANVDVTSGIINENLGRIEIIDSFASLSVNISNTNKHIAGFIGYNGRQSESGTAEINFDSAISLTLNAFTVEKVSSVTGFAYQNSGNIKGIASAININAAGSSSPKLDAGELAGLVNTMHKGNVNGFTIGFINVNNAADVNVDKFGGAVVYLNGGQIGDDAVATVIKLPLITTNVFGGVVANVTEENETKVISNVQIGTENAKLNILPRTDVGSAYGLVIGQYSSKVSIDYKLTAEIDFDVAGGQNVGAIIGQASNGEFEFNCEKPGITTVSGGKNVGGFIGLYEDDDSSLSVGGNSWAIKEEYAKVGASVKTGGSDAEYSPINFGGLIGCWKSEAVLSGVENLNPVLTDGLSDLFAYGEKSYIRNIGGVVGYTTAGISESTNSAQVGPDLELSTNYRGSANPISGINEGDVGADAVIDKFIQLYYIGGVAGFVDGDGDDVTILTDNNNTSSITGMYAVGGLVGGNDGKISIYSTIGSTDVSVGKNESSVVGIANVGGVIGQADTAMVGPNAVAEKNGTSSITAGGKLSIEFSNIIGVINVGGFIGYANLGSVANVRLKAELVVGNADVGGFIGYATSGRVSYSIIPETTEICGSAFDIKDGEGENLKDYYYIPTNIGGAGGFIGNGFGEDIYTDFENVEINSKIITDDSYEAGMNSKIKLTASANTNHFASLSQVRSVDYTSSDASGGANYLRQYYPINRGKEKYDTMQSGIGGFVGRSANIISDSSDNSSFNNDVYAPLGINVGGLVGYYAGDPRVKLPAMEDDINIAGRVCVGGYIGKIDEYDSANTSNFFISNPAQINIQRYKDNKDKDASGQPKSKSLAGSIVGGVFGYAQCSIVGVHLDDSYVKDEESLIKIFNGGEGALISNYVGTIVGRIDGNIQDCNVDYRLCDAKYDTSTKIYDWKLNELEKGDDVLGIIQNPLTFNYGGLVGLVKTSGGVNIQGTHFYPFTVDVVQNYGFDEGTPEYRKAQYFGENAIVANAHYINNANIKISASGAIGLYDRGTDTSVDGSYFGKNCNPTNSSARGWAKEYTMFRAMSRGIQQGVDTGDSVQLIYSADNITEVATGWTLADEETQLWLSGEIAYTIYQPTGQNARLYCKYGIADLSDATEIQTNNETASDWKWLQDFKEWFVGEKGALGKSYTKDYTVSLNAVKDGVSKLYYEWAGKAYKFKPNEEDGYEGYIVKDKNPKNPDGTYNVEGRDAFWINITLQNFDPKYYDGESDVKDIFEPANNDHGFKIKEDYDDDLDLICAYYNYTFGNTCYVVNDYLGEGQKIFKFSRVFGDRTMSGGIVDMKLLNEDKTFNSQTLNENHLSASGSIFDVSGTTVSIADVDVFDSQRFTTAIFTFLADVALTVLSIYCPAFLAVKYGKYALNAMKAIKTLSKVKKALSLIGIGMGALTLWNSYNSLYAGVGADMDRIFNSTTEVEVLYNSLNDQSLGYLGADYMREVIWDGEGNMVVSPDDGVPIPVPMQLKVGTGNSTTDWTPEKIKTFVIDDTSAYGQYLKSNLGISQGSSGLQFDSDYSNSLYQADGKWYLNAQLDYYSMSQSNYLPNTEQFVDVQVDQLNDGEIRTILTGLGVETISVPAAISLDGEIYSYTNKEIEGKMLYQNYSDIANAELFEDWQLINEGGYAYTLDLSSGYVTNANTASAYGVPHRIDRVVKCKIGFGTNVRNIKNVDFAELTWVQGSPEGTGLSKDATLYYYGDTKPSGYSVEFLNGSTTEYYVARDTGGATKTFTLIPQVGGIGFASSEIGFNETHNSSYFYYFDENGSLEVSAEYGLCKDIVHANSDTGESYVWKNLEDLGVGDTDGDGEDDTSDTLLSATPIEVFKYWYNEDTKKYEYVKVEVIKNLYDLKTNWNEEVEIVIDGEKVKVKVIECSLSSDYYDVVSNTYRIHRIGDKDYLEMKSASGERLIVEEKNGEKFAYTPLYGDVIQNSILLGKYCQQYDYHGITYNLYTRFRYSDKSAFFNATIKDETMSMEYKLLSNTHGRNSTLLESVRVSLNGSSKLECVVPPINRG